MKNTAATIEASMEMNIAAKPLGFSEAVSAELNALYATGMVGIGLKYEGLIEIAKERTKLTDKQIKVGLLI